MKVVLKLVKEFIQLSTMRGFLQNSYFSVNLHKWMKWTSALHLRNGTDKEPAGLSLSLGSE